MPELAAKYMLTGNRIRRNTGRREDFETTIIAMGYDDAQSLARDNWSWAWRDVRFTKVVQVQ